MKYLSDYTQAAQTKCFEETGSFFAFSNKQLDEKKQDGVTYVSLGHGLICPKQNAKEVHERLNNIHAEGIKLDIEENGIEAIIKRELGNYECYYTGEIDDAVDALEDYDDITVEMIKNVFKGKPLNYVA